MQALWSGGPTAYEGGFGGVRASHAYPKPARAPRGPVTGPRTLVGGTAGPKLFAHPGETEVLRALDAHKGHLPCA